MKWFEIIPIKDKKPFLITSKKIIILNKKSNDYKKYEN